MSVLLRFWLVLPILVHLAAASLFLSQPYSITDFPLDDAWIHRVYAENISRGHGLSYNPGTPEAGSSSLLWTLATTPAHWIHGPQPVTLVLAIKTIGIVLGVLFIVICTLAIRHLTTDRRVATFAGVLLAIEPRLLFSELSGMETTLLLVLWAGAALALLQKRHLLALLLLGLAPTARPEAVILLPFALLPLVDLYHLKNSCKPLLMGVVATTLPSLLWMSLCFSATGKPLPNTFYVKAVPFHLGFIELSRLLTILIQNGWAATLIFLPGLIAFATWCFSSNDRNRILACALFLGAPLLYALAVAGTRFIATDGYYWTRWIDPASLLLTAAWSCGLTLFLFKGPKSPLLAAFPGNIRRPLICSAGLLVLFCSSPFLASFQATCLRLNSDSRIIRILNVDMGIWINEHTPSDAIVAVNDAGAIRFFGHRETLDLLGLNLANRAFGRVSMENLIQQSDWLVVYPRRLDVGDRLDYIYTLFEPRHSITIPQKEYTICHSPAQTLITAYEKKSVQP